MTEKISKYQEMIGRLKDDQKVIYLDQPKDVEVITEIDKQMEAVRREYQIKEKNSQISAANVILTA
ncbi:MAG: hypothetical protein NTW10_02395 [Bacteroidetes bacterium]|nr:hypothetical protein [Bacteroidota bacterium]